ncbi:MAG: hypothetical protein ACE366_27055 [Bradymonadia bacterium]
MTIRNTTRALTSSALAFAALLISTTALAAPETHDGFSFQANLGPAVQSWQLEFDNGGGDERYAVSGEGMLFDFTFGGAVTENLILFGQLSTVSTVGPDIELESNGRARTFRDDTIAATATSYGFGAMYYIPSLNMYAGGSVLTTRARLGAHGLTTTSDRGLGLHLRVGKEWWVSEDWGLGIAAHAFGNQIPTTHTDEGEQMGMTTFALTFSATYN